MSYIEGSSPGFTQAVISFWFKVAQKEMDIVQKEYDDWWDAYDPESDRDPPPFLGLVPLVVFGPAGTSPNRGEGKGQSKKNENSTHVHHCVEYAADSYDGITLNMWAWSECNDYDYDNPYYSTTWDYELKPGKPQEPSYVAVDGYGSVIIHFESAQTGNVTLASVIKSFTDKYYTQESSKQCWTFPVVGYCGDYSNSVTGGPDFCSVMIIVFTLIGWRMSTAVADTFVDEGSSSRTEHKETYEFGSGPGDVGTGALSCSPTSVAADMWHHVLISVDMSGGSASKGIAVGEQVGDPKSHITATSEIYVAVDDKNYKTGTYPFENTNKVYTGSSAQIAWSYQTAFWDDDAKKYVPQGPVPSYSIGSLSVPAGDIGMPSQGKYVDKIRHCELAEFQMFPGKTLDTSEESNRRLFLDFKRDANGRVIPDGDGTARLKPVKPAVAEEKLGKPAINMHGSNKWIKGTNLGSGGAFTPTGEIKKYKPDPAIRPRG